MDVEDRKKPGPEPQGPQPEKEISRAPITPLPAHFGLGDGVFIKRPPAPPEWRGTDKDPRIPFTGRRLSEIADPAIAAYRHHMNRGEEKEIPKPETPKPGEAVGAGDLPAVMGIPVDPGTAENAATELAEELIGNLPEGAQGMVMRDPEGNISLPTIIAQPVPGEGGNPALAGEKPPPTVTVNVPIKVPGGRAGAGVFRNVGLGGMVPPEAHTRQAQVGADPTFSQAALGGNVPIRQVSVDPETGEEVETYRLGQPGEIGMQSPLLFTHEEVGTEAIAQSDPTIVAAVYIPPEYGGEEITGTLVTATVDPTGRHERSSQPVVVHGNVVRTMAAEQTAPYENVQNVATEIAGHAQQQAEAHGVRERQGQEDAETAKERVKEIIKTGIKPAIEVAAGAGLNEAQRQAREFMRNTPGPVDAARAAHERAAEAMAPAVSQFTLRNLGNLLNAPLWEGAQRYSFTGRGNPTISERARQIGRNYNQVREGIKPTPIPIPFDPRGRGGGLEAINAERIKREAMQAAGQQFGEHLRRNQIHKPIFQWIGGTARQMYNERVGGVYRRVHGAARNLASTVQEGVDKGIREQGTQYMENIATGFRSVGIQAQSETSQYAPYYGDPGLRIQPFRVNINPIVSQTGKPLGHAQNSPQRRIAEIQRRVAELRAEAARARTNNRQNQANRLTNEANNLSQTPIQFGFGHPPVPANRTQYWEGK